jgi:hypothetical protein
MRLIKPSPAFFAGLAKKGRKSLMSVLLGENTDCFWLLETVTPVC